jgi:hypothetical protein
MTYQNQTTTTAVDEQHHYQRREDLRSREDAKLVLVIKSKSASH